MGQFGSKGGMRKIAPLKSDRKKDANKKAPEKVTK